MTVALMRLKFKVESEGHCVCYTSMYCGVLTDGRAAAACDPGKQCVIIGSRHNCSISGRGMLVRLVVPIDLH